MISKEEMIAKFKARQLEKFGGEKNFKAHIKSQKSSIGKALGKYNKSKEPGEHEKLNYQHKTGRGYHE